MIRYATGLLNRWKNDGLRKPLIVRGARQVGKTWLMKDFGNKNYINTAYINFENAPALKNLFTEDFNISRIINAIEIETGEEIKKEETLIIFDEIQEVKRGVTALKYFYENAPEYHVMAAGSLLGIGMHRHTSFPVGKVDFLNLYPMTFSEFLSAAGEKKLLKLLIDKDYTLIKTFKNKFINLLKQYYFTGGMPEVVSVYFETGSYNKARDIQNKILAGYELDFSKHAPPKEIPLIRMLWNSIPAQLSKENKKFIYSAVKKGARAKDFETALNWLVDSGIVYKIHRVSKPGLPLNAYEDFTAFKLFLSDVGLLGAMSDLSVKTIIEESKIFEEFKGVLSEQFVLQQLKATIDKRIFYWSAQKSQAEIDFIFQINDNIYPVEVKAKENLQSKSLKSFFSKYPETKPLRFSMSDFRKESWLTNIPLYMVNTINDTPSFFTTFAAL